MIIALVLTALIGIILLIGVYQGKYQIPKLEVIVLLIGTIITYLFIGFNFVNVKFLDIAHPTYSDGGISTFAILISLAGGMTFTIPVSLYYLLQLAHIDRVNNKRKKEKE